MVDGDAYTHDQEAVAEPRGCSVVKRGRGVGVGDKGALNAWRATFRRMVSRVTGG